MAGFRMTSSRPDMMRTHNLTAELRPRHPALSQGERSKRSGVRLGGRFVFLRFEGS
jgi:hypothetical protein